MDKTGVSDSSDSAQAASEPAPLAGSAAAAAGEVDWPALFFAPDPGHAERLMARARRRFGAGADAESAYNHALDALSADDWARLRNGYKGRGSAAGFMAITFNNLLEDYAVRKYGRRRPPVWVQRLGGVWPRIYEMLCLRRSMPESIVATLCMQGTHDPEEIRRAVKEVGGRIPDCGKVVGESYLADDLAPVMDRVAAGDDSAAPLESGDLGDLLGALSAVFADPAGGGQSGSTAGSSALGERLGALQDAIDLAPDEKLLLQLVYREGFSLAKAARSLRLHEQKARRLHKALLERLRAAFAEFEVL